MPLSTAGIDTARYSKSYVFSLQAARGDSEAPESKPAVLERDYQQTNVSKEPRVQRWPGLYVRRG